MQHFIFFFLNNLSEERGNKKIRHKIKKNGKKGRRTEAHSRRWFSFFIISNKCYEYDVLSGLRCLGNDDYEYDGRGRDGD